MDAQIIVTQVLQLQRTEQVTTNQESDHAFLTKHRGT